ncbi:MAG TPA: hypothetical protein VGC82_19935, partial [Rhodopila sp.]
LQHVIGVVAGNRIIARPTMGVLDHYPGHATLLGQCVGDISGDRAKPAVGRCGAVLASSTFETDYAPLDR